MIRKTLLLIAFLALSSCSVFNATEAPTSNLCIAPDLRPNRAAATQIVELDRPFAEDLAVYQSLKTEFCEDL